METHVRVFYSLSFQDEFNSGFYRSRLLFALFMIPCDRSEADFSWLNGNSHPSFLFRKAGSESFPCEYACTTLVNEPDKYGETVGVVYKHTKRTQEMRFADWTQ